MKICLLTFFFIILDTEHAIHVCYICACFALEFIQVLQIGANCYCKGANLCVIVVLLDCY